MMRATARRFTLPFLATALLSACASTPVTSYRLASEPGPVEQVAPLTLSVPQCQHSELSRPGQRPQAGQPLHGRLIPQRALGRPLR